MSYAIGASTYETIMENLGGERKNSTNNDEEKLVEEEAGGCGGANLPLHHNRRRIIPSNVVTILVLFTIVTLSCLLLYRSTSARQFFPNLSYFKHGNFSATSSPSSSMVVENSVEKVLEKAAMANRTVIITTLNAAWTRSGSIFDLFLESFRIGNQTEGLLKHVVVVALDKTAYARCRELHPHCYALTTVGVDFSGEAHFMSQDYLKMMWRRIDFLRLVLQMGYSFIFTDADIMWLRQPFSQFYPDTDFQIACDHYWYDSSDLNNSPNGGFNYVKSNNRSIEFYKFWYKSREAFPGKHDQDVLNIIKFDPFIKQIGLKIRFLKTAYFGGFCEPSKDLNLVCTMHANCCIGLDNKIHDLKMVIGDWKNYMGLASNERTSRPRTWTVPRRCG
ncbi:PREDICTED: uncharacterized protein At4g15970-like isoform X3 [Ipomoea nil]|uniref:uncharacterized protein At4g15970-like isoform X3 n=1 Tax=Ipomoea nil TaxID=35883 RepID=UPI000900AD97|nr:PREDICTED: uncharacterized protein At4g15970-like isoform X3 [Ipomoea nil]